MLYAPRIAKSNDAFLQESPGQRRETDSTSLPVCGLVRVGLAISKPTNVSKVGCNQVNSFFYLPGAEAQAMYRLTPRVSANSINRFRENRILSCSTGSAKLASATSASRIATPESPEGPDCSIVDRRMTYASAMLLALASSFAGFDEILTLQWGDSRTSRPFHWGSIDIFNEVTSSSE